MKKILFLLLASFYSFCASAQIDTEFWFACPDLTASHQSQDAIALNFVSYEQPAVITITQPANPNFTPVTRTMGPNDHYTFSLGNHRAKVETVADGNVQKTGIHITSTSPITAYYSATAQNSEIYTFKGRNALGTKFTVPMQFDYECKENAYSSIEIVATEDNTAVSITTRVATNVSATPGTVNITLNKGQSYAIRSVNKNTPGAEHLHNTKIVSDKPIAVNSTDDSATTYNLNFPWGDKDLVGDQIVPENLLAAKYIAISNLSAHERAYISAVEPNTTIYIHDNNGERQLVTLNPGDEFTCPLDPNSGTMFFTKDETPFVLFQLTANGGELGGSMLPGLDCSGSSEVSYKRTLGTQIGVAVLTRTENIGSFVVNGSTRVLSGSTFIPVPGDEDWSYAVGVNITGDYVKIENTTGTFHLGIFDAQGGTCSYGYFSNYGNIPLKFVTDQTHYIEGETIKFRLYDAGTLKDIRWIGPKGVFGEGEVAPEITNVTMDDAGMYIIEANHKEGCAISPDTFFVSILQKADKKEVIACRGNTVTLKAEGKGDAAGKYEWTPTGLPATQEVTVMPTVDGEEYTVKNYMPGLNRAENGDFTSAATTDFTSGYTYGGISSTALNLPGTYTVGTSPHEYNATYSNVPEHTGNNGNQFIAHFNDGESVIWEQTLTNLVIGNRYQFSAWFRAAKNNDAPLKVRLKVNNEQSPIIVVQNGNEWNSYEFEWTCDDVAATISIQTVASTKAGGAICIDDIQFSPLLLTSNTFGIKLLDFLNPQIMGDPRICKGEATLTLDTDYDSYVWNTSETTKTITVTLPGEYTVEVKSGACDGNAAFTVLPSENVEFALGDIPQICSGDNDFQISYTEVVGEVGKALITFDEKALNAGFINDDNLHISGNLITVNMPINAAPDIYNANLILEDRACEEKNEFPVTFTVRYSNDIFAQRWNDVLGIKNAAYNGGYTFTGYQWYKNGSPMPESTASYIYEKAHFSATDSYTVLLTRNDGVEIFTCEFSPETIGDNVVIPTVVTPMQEITLQNVASDGTVIIVNNSGQISSIQPVSANKQTVRMPGTQGLYILSVNADGKVESHRIFVKE